MNCRRFLAVSLVVVLGACAAPGAKFTALAPVAADRAHVYVYRQSALYAIGQSFDVELNQKPVGEIFNASYLLLNVLAGPQVVTVKPGGLAKNSVYEIQTESGKNYFLEYSVNNSLLANPFFLGSGINTRSQEQALKDLQQLKSAN